MRFIMLFFFVVSSLFAQPEWHRWEAKKINYELPVNSDDKSFSGETELSVKIFSAVKEFYSFVISDLDGDNCPFYPSCSQFFVESIKETNIFQGAVMFSDRFTRDINFFKNIHQYSLHSSGKLFDPVENHTMLPHKYIYKQKNILQEYIVD